MIKILRSPKFITLATYLISSLLTAQATEISDEKGYLLDQQKLNVEFWEAAAKGNTVGLEYLKNRGANVYASDIYGNNALHYAALFAPEGRGVAWLIDTAEIAIESKSNGGKVPFLMAAEQGKLTTLKILRSKGANVYATDLYGNSALHYAVLFAPKSIEWLIDTARISIESKNKKEETPFLCAAKKGNLVALQILKKKGANVHAIDIYGNNALYCALLYAPNSRGLEWLINTTKISIESKECYQKSLFICAAEKGNLEALKILKAKGANVYVKDQYENNALHSAALYAPSGKSIEWLIDVAKIPIESKEYYQKTPFICAAEKGNLTALKVLKSKGANVYAKDQYGYNALNLAAMYASSKEGIEWLIDVAKIPIESKGESQKTPFLMAVEKGNLPALKILKAKGANLYAKDQYGNSALHYAAHHVPNEKSIIWLIDVVRLNIESKGQNQATPFLMAAEVGSLLALRILKQKGANLHAKNQYGNNALHYAAYYTSNDESIIWLIDRAGIPIESKGRNQATPFLMAAEAGNLLALKTLKAKGANLHAKNQYGNNALHYATYYPSGSASIIWLINTARIPIESKGEYQKTPFLCAASEGNLEALKILKSKGANLHAKDQYGDNALHYAALYAPKGNGIAWLIDTAKIAIESKGYYQKTPFLMAAEKGNLATLKILKTKGANIYAKDQYGSNSLVYANKYSNSQDTIDWVKMVYKLT